MGFGDSIQGIGGNTGLLMIGANLLSSQKGQEGRALSQGIMGGAQLHQQQEANKFRQQRAQVQREQQDMARQQYEQQQQQRQNWQQFVQGPRRDTSAASVAGVGATPEQSQFDPGALNAAQVIGGGQLSEPGDGNPMIPKELQDVLNVLPPEEGQKLYQNFLEDRRDAAQKMGLEEFRQNRQDSRQQQGIQGQYGLAGYKAQLSAQNRRPSAQDQKYQQLVDGGMDPQMASLVAGGGVKLSRDPMTGEASVINLSDPATWNNPQSQGGPTIDINEANGPDDDYSAGDVSSAFGAGGVGRNAVNTAFELFGARQPYKPSAEAQRTVSSLQRDFQTDMVSDLGGRPSNYSQQQLEPIMTRPNQLLEGPESAYSAIQQQREMYNERLGEAQSVANGRYPVKDRAEAQRMVDRFQNRIKRYDSVLENWGGGERPSYASGRDQGDMPMPPAADDPELDDILSRY